MDFDSSDNSDAHFLGGIKMKTFKELQREKLVKDGVVVPASKLAETAKRNAQLLKDFEAAAEDELRHRISASKAPKDKLDNLPLTRERFED
jgi:hypothetical protein